MDSYFTVQKNAQMSHSLEYQEAPFVAFDPISGFWLTEESPGLLAMLPTISTFPVYCLQ